MSPLMAAATASKPAMTHFRAVLVETRPELGGGPGTVLSTSSSGTVVEPATVVADDVGDVRAAPDDEVGVADLVGFVTTPPADRVCRVVDGISTAARLVVVRRPVLDVDVASSSIVEVVEDAAWASLEPSPSTVAATRPTRSTRTTRRRDEDDKRITMRS